MQVCLQRKIVVQKKRVAVEIKRKIMKSGKEMSRKVWENLSFEDKMQLRRDMVTSYKKLWLVVCEDFLMEEGS